MNKTSKKVLYAEDEYTNREILKISLNKIGIECDLVDEGLEALRMCKENEYNLIILDQYMPNLNGDEIAKIVKTIKPNIPMIAITSDDEMEKHLRSSGFSEVIIKPIYKKNFLKTIMNYL